MTPYDRAWDMGVYTEYMTVYDGICQVVRIPDGRVEHCSGGQRGRCGRAAAEASAADPPAAAASGPSCKGQGCKTESVMIGMNALIDLE